MKRPITEAQKAAKAKYRKKAHQVNLTFYPTETDMWEHLESQTEKKATYIKDLIRKDMKGETK